MYVIVDIDGTCADGSHRKHLLETAPRKWDEWHELCHLDANHRHINQLVWALFDAGYNIVYITGRMERSREKTRTWLRTHHFPEGPLYMRPENDHRDDIEIKMEAANQAGLTPERVLFAIDDRDRVVKMWRDAGYKCLQVAEGSF